MNLLRPRATTKKVVSVLLAPFLLLGSVLNAAPARAQVELAPRTAATSVSALPAAIRLTPAALTAAPLSSALTPLAPGAAVPGAPAAAPAPLAAAPAALQLAPAAAPAAQAAAAPIRAAASLAARSTAVARQAVRRLTEVPSKVKDAFAGLALFDGGNSRAPAFSQGFITPFYTEPTLPAGVTLDRRPSRAPPALDHALNLRPAGGPAAVALDADPADMAAVEKALRKLVDSDPQQYGASSDQMAPVSVETLPALLPGQLPSIVAVFRHEILGTDQDGSAYRLNVDGGGLAFHMKVIDGKPVVLWHEGQLASGVTPDIMTPRFTDEQLAGLAQKRLQTPPDRLPGSSPNSKEEEKNPSRPHRRSPKTRRGKKHPRRGAALTAVAAAGAASDAAPEVKFLTRSITNQFDGVWRAINLYQASDLKGAPIIVGIDIKSGKAFAFSAQDVRLEGRQTVAAAQAAAPRRASPPAPAAPADAPSARALVPAAPAGAITGTVLGRGTTLTETGDDNGPIGPIPMPLTNVYDQSGKVVAVTDENGNFTIPSGGSAAPVKLTIRLTSPLVPFVNDVDAAKNGPVEVTLTATPGAPLTVTLNPVSDDLEMAANIVGFAGYLEHHLWLKKLPGMNGAHLDRPLAGGIHTNSKEQQGNAFYDPTQDRVVLMSAAVLTVHDSHGKPVKISVENTSKQSIDYHEYTHRVVQTYSQRRLSAADAASAAFRFVKWTVDAIMGADVNESIADFVSYCMRNSPIIGAGFYGNLPAGKPNYIRNATEKTVYDPQDPDPHNGVTVQAMWSLRDEFMKTLGPEQGKAYAAAMIPLIFLAQPLNPVSALYHIMLWDMRADGTSPFASALRRIAKGDHGIDLPPLPTPPGPPSV